MTMNAALPFSDDPAPSLTEFVVHAYLRRRTAQAIFGFVFGAALLTAALIPAQFQAVASLAVMPSPEFTVREDAGSHAFSNTALAMDQIMKAETEILGSADLHEAAIAGLAPRPVDGGTIQNGALVLYPDLAPNDNGHVLARSLSSAVTVLSALWQPSAGQASSMVKAMRRFDAHLRVLPAKDSNVITLTFAHRDAVMAAKALNLLLVRYAERRQKLYNDPQLAVAEREMDANAALVRRADLALLSFNASRHYSDYAVERDLLLRRRSQAAQALADATALEAQSRARLLTLTHEIRSLPSSNGVFQERDTDVRMQAVDNSLVDLRGRLAAARDHYRETSRTVMGLRQQIGAREADRTIMARNPTPSVLRSGRSLALDPLLVDRVHAAADQTSAKAQADTLQREIAALDDRLSRLDQDAAVLADLSRQKAVATDTYATTSRIVAELKLSEAEDVRRLANVRVVQPARVPDRANGTKVLICLAGLTLGLAAAAGWLVVRFITQPTFLTPRGLTAATGLPVLGLFEKAA